MTNQIASPASPSFQTAGEWRGFGSPTPWTQAEAGSHGFGNRTRATHVLAVLAVGLLCLSPGSAHAQFVDASSLMSGMNGAANIEGLTVVGKATIGAKPTFAEVDLDVSASAELTGDAIVKFRDAKKRVQDAFSALKLPNVTIEERGLLVDQKGAMPNPYYYNPGQNTKTKTEVQLSRKLVVKAAEIGAMDEAAVLQLVARLLDVAQDAGAHVGPQTNMNRNYYYYEMNGMTAPSLVRFVLEDFEKVQELAYEKAVADARSRAERLARLSGVELGPVLAIREIVVPTDHVGRSRLGGGGGGDDEVAPQRLETNKFQEVPVRVELHVRFSIHPKGQVAGGAR